MTKKSRQCKKSANGHMIRTLSDQNSNGMSKPNTPPISTSTCTQHSARMVTPSVQYIQPSTLIHQSNELLYGSQLQTPIQNGMMTPPQPPSPMAMPMPMQAFQQQAVQGPQAPSVAMPHYATGMTNQFIQPSHNTVNNHGQQTQNTVSDQPAHIASILQSLDTRLGKIENQLGHQNQQLNQQNTRIHNIEGHVKQITVLKQNVCTVQNKVYTIEVDMKHIKSKQTEYDCSVNTCSDLCDEVLKSQASINQRIDELNNQLKFLQTSEIENIKHEHNDLKEEFLDTKCRQMCENLIFTGINEVYLGPGEHENCENTLLEFLARHMGIYQDIKLDRVHRLGRYRRNQARPRPIIAKFHEFKTKEMVKRKAPEMLRDTHFGIREQYPEEYERRRKVLYPKMKAAKNNPDNRVRMVKDTLYINNEKFICGQNIPVKVDHYHNNGTRNYNTNVMYGNNPNSMTQSFRTRTVHEHTQSQSQNDNRNVRTSTSYQTPNRRYPTQPAKSTSEIRNEQINKDATTGTQNKILSSFESENR